MVDMAFQTWLIFVATSIGISLSPGPNCLLVLTHASQHGIKRCLSTIAGGLLAFAIVIGMCAYGLGALLQASVAWITLVKIVGGLYLAWLGVKIWRSAPIEINLSKQAAHGNHGLFRQGFLCGITNPKSYLFFAALLPHFLDPNRSLLLQFIVITATYTVTEFAAELAVAAFAVRIRPWLARVGRRFNKACGGLFIAIGLALPLRS